MVRLPGLLDASLAEVARLKPISGNLTIKMMGASEATLTIAEDDQTVTVHDWISLYTQRGFAGVFRVSNVAQTYKRQIELTLLHGIDVLADSVWAAQTDFNGTKTQYLTRLLNQQTHLINGQRPWVLGVCEDTETFERTINYDRLSTLLEELEEEGGDYYFTYDQTSFPWVLNYVQKPSGVASEFRLSRNVQTATVTYNDSDLCTRLILSVNHRVEDSDTNTSSTDTAIRTYNNTDAQAIWGVVVKTADIDTSDDVAHNVFTKANKWAQKFLNKRAAPTVQIQIDGEELYYLTGDTWDEYSVGKICQTALPAYGHTFLERVVSVTYPALYAQPSRVTVSLANTLPKFSESISKASKTAESAAASARGTARGAASAKDLTTWSQHVKYYGEALDGTGVLTLYESGIDMDAAGGVKIYSLVEGVQSLYAGIQVTANGIESLVTKTGVNSLGQNETLFSKITQNAGLIDLVVDNSGQQASIRIDAIVDDINSSGTAIKLNANKIYLNGQTIASVISATQANIDNLITGTTKATLINSDSVVGDTVTGGTVYATNQLSIGSSSSGGSGSLYYRGIQYYRQALTLGANGAIATAYVLGDATAAKSFDHYHAITATEGTGADAGKIILTLSDPIATSDTTHSTTNFNIAATTTYRNGVLAARNAVAVNPFTANATTGEMPDHRTFTYTTDAPTPAQGTEQIDTWYLAGGTSWDSSTHQSLVQLHYGSPNGTPYASLTVDATDVYNSVTVGAPYSVNGAVPAGETRTSIPMRADASNGNRGAMAGLYMQVVNYGTMLGLGRCVNIVLGGIVIGRYSVQSIYDAGVAAGENEFSLTSVTLQGSSVSVTPIRSTTAIRIDNSVVTLYEAGTETKYDRGSSVTARPVVSSGGTIYYQAGSQTTYYKGDGSEVTGRGDSVKVTPVGKKYWYQWHASTETPTGSWYTQHTSNPGGSYVIRYEAGTETTYYKGNGSKVTGRGDEAAVTPIKATTAVRLGTAGTYYDGSGGEFTVQGASQDAYKKLTSGGTLYYRAGDQTTYYQEGSTVTDTYYTKS